MQRIGGVVGVAWAGQRGGIDRGEEAGCKRCSRAARNGRVDRERTK